MGIVCGCLTKTEPRLSLNPQVSSGRKNLETLSRTRLQGGTILPKAVFLFSLWSLTLMLCK